MDIGGVTFNVGSTIKFRTKNMYDQNIYTGSVVAITNYSVASLLQRDINTYHTNVAKTVTDLGEVNEMDYFVLTTDTEKNIAFAVDWIDEGSIALVSFTDTATFKVFDITEADIPIIQKLLTDNGYRNRTI